MDSKLTIEERKSILFDCRDITYISKEFDISQAYISNLRTNYNGAANFLRSHMDEYDHKLESWSREKRNYIKRKYRFDKSKTKEEHAVIFDLENPKPLRDDYNAT